MNPTSNKSKTAFIVLNPVAGKVNPDLLRSNIETRFYANGWQTRIHVTKKDEKITAVVKQEIENGADLIVATGGDGTIAAVAAGMVRSAVPLGIIPTGTWNAIARNLMLPVTVTSAINLMTGRHSTKRLDLMLIGNKIHAMNMGIGFSSQMIANTEREGKRKFGNLAYFSNVIKQAFGLQQRRYTIEADGKRYRGRAAEIFVANYGLVGWNNLESSLDIKPDDGKVDVLIMRARTVFDLPSLFWHMFFRRGKRSPKYQQLSAAGSILIRTSPPSPIQADGELLGETPVTVSVLQRCVKVIVPLEKKPVIPGQKRAGK